MKNIADKILPLALLIVVVFCVILYWQNNGLRKTLDSIRKDTTTATVNLNITPPKINIDTVEAYLVVKSALRKSDSTKRLVQRAYDSLSSVYKKTIADIDSGYYDIPTAVLDDSIPRILPDGNYTYDKVHTEYIYPPVNNFVGTVISLGQVPVKIEYQREYVDIYIHPSTWKIAKYYGAGVLTGIVAWQILEAFKR